MAEREWIGVVTGRVVRTVAIKANSRKEAEEKLKAFGGADIEGLQDHYEETGRRVLRENKTLPPPHAAQKK